MTLRNYLKDKKILFDGAFGTYFSALDNSGMMPERANLENPNLVKEIHKEYIKAGARIIRTNTFASNLAALRCTREELAQNLNAGFGLAVEAAKEAKEEMFPEVSEAMAEEIFIAADMGPLPAFGEMAEEEIYGQYKFICDTFLNAGAEVLVFETMPDVKSLLPVIRDVKAEADRDIFIIVQFCMNQHGYTGSGVSMKKLLRDCADMEEIDAVGFNCGVGPGHLYTLLHDLDLNIGKFITALPNASYPKNIQDRMVFLKNKDYFARKLEMVAGLGVDMLGGCCGTNPEYIKRAGEIISFSQSRKEEKVKQEGSQTEVGAKDNHFYAGKGAGEKLIAVELSPPPHANPEDILDAANLLKRSKVDVVTFPDSPSGRTRTDSILMAVKVANEVKINVMPHICCRDKNAIAMRSQILGAHMNGVKNMLIITGDPVPSMVRQNVKSVFNFDSVRLMQMIQEMNEEEFPNDRIAYGGAINYNRRNLDVEIGRVKKKMEAGADYFLTQPLFSREDAEKIKRIKEQTKARILCGIMPLISAKNALFIKNEIAGIHVPDEVLEKFKEGMTRKENEAVGVEIARASIENTFDFADGYYFSIPFNRVYLLDSIMEGILD